MINFKLPDGSSLDVEQPGKAIAPAWILLTLGLDGTPTQVEASTGAAQEQTPADIAAEQTWVVYLLGGGLMLVGVILIAAKKWFPLIPISAGLGAMGAGAAVIVLVLAAQSIPPWFWMVGGSLALIIVAGGWWINRRQVKKPLVLPGDPL